MNDQQVIATLARLSIAMRATGYRWETDTYNSAVGDLAASKQQLAYIRMVKPIFQTLDADEQRILWYLYLSGAHISAIDLHTQLGYSHGTFYRKRRTALNELGKLLTAAGISTGKTDTLK
ncbi:hypothetical protein [Lacticaseibacillus rhamnosus]|uniref:hypothetical protein n=1 Tax=Lacticaseibacillus rhamnosus TaxID=47715 RepID=UPI00237F56C0|nr:hypothetical protein [Lacticaseibacillus rhamnosus]MDE3295721.1 hypothetical protein [Lacticaseibacillus rhamnosus]